MKKRRTWLVILIVIFAIALAVPGGVLVMRWIGRGVNDAMTLPAADDVGRHYVLKTPDAEQLGAVTLFADGTAQFTMPAISSYIPPACTWKETDRELLLRAVIANAWGESYYGVQAGEVIARFTVVGGGKSIVFKEASVPLFAESGTYYVLDKNSALTD